nr:hypothetical protein [Dehalococcoidales bacterium]
VFRPKDGGTPPGTYTVACGLSAALLGAGVEPDDPTTAKVYFKRLFETVDTDAHGVQDLRRSFAYPEVARRFRMIEDDTESVVVPYGPADAQQATRTLVDRLRAGNPEARTLVRRLQPYLVSLRKRQAEKYRRQGLLTPILPGLGQWLGAYDPIRGLTGDDPDPDTLVV